MDICDIISTPNKFFMTFVNKMHQGSLVGHARFYGKDLNRNYI